MKINFKEEQKFTQWWLWIILAVIGLIPVFGIYKETNSISQWVVGIFICALIVLFWMIKLRTEISENGIKMTFFPFVKKKIKWKEIKEVKVVNYGFVGGWGIRFGTKYGTVYNIKGKFGLAIKLNTGKKFLIGTQKK